MANLYINGLKYKFDTIIEFDTDTDLKECFFFKNGKLITSQFLNLFEINKLKQ